MHFLAGAHFLFEFSNRGHFFCTTRLDWPVSFVPQVSGFSSRANGIDGDDDQDHGEDEDGSEPGVERYMLEEKWRNGEWPKYPLFIIILGG